MIVVTNTSPILNLSIIGHLDILESLYGKVFIPEAVLRELSAHGIQQPAIQEIPWIEVKAVTGHLLLDWFLVSLHAGEAEAITLSKEIKSELLLIDERIGRKVADRVGLKFTGLLGVLIEAKHKELITKIKPLLDGLIVKAGFWIKP